MQPESPADHGSQFVQPPMQQTHLSFPQHLQPPMHHMHPGAQHFVAFQQLPQFLPPNNTLYHQHAPTYYPSVLPSGVASDKKGASIVVARQAPPPPSPLPQASDGGHVQPQLSPSALQQTNTNVISPMVYVPTDGSSFSNSGPQLAPLSMASLTTGHSLLGSTGSTLPAANYAIPTTMIPAPQTQPLRQYQPDASVRSATTMAQQPPRADPQTAAQNQAAFGAAFPQMRPLEPNEGSPGSNLIVNYIPPEVSESELRQIFEQFGPVHSACTVKNTTTRRSREYGFVLFFETADAIKAREALHGFSMYGKRLRVAFANNQAYSDVHRSVGGGSSVSNDATLGGGEVRPLLPSAQPLDGSSTHPTVAEGVPSLAQQRQTQGPGFDISLSLHSNCDAALLGEPQKELQAIATFPLAYHQPTASQPEGVAQETSLLAVGNTSSASAACVNNRSGTSGPSGSSRETSTKSAPGLNLATFHSTQ